MSCGSTFLKIPDSVQQKLCVLAKEGDLSARNYLLKSVYPLIIRYARTGMVGFEDRYDDLIQEGCLGVLRGIPLFVPSEGAKFSTYISWWIATYIARFKRGNLRGTAVRYPRSAVAGYFKDVRSCRLVQCIGGLYKVRCSSGIEYPVGGLAEAVPLDLPEEDAMSGGGADGDDDDVSSDRILSDTLVSDSDTSEGVSLDSLLDFMRNSLSSERHRKMFDLLVDTEDADAVAEVFGVSRSCVGSVFREARKNARVYLREHGC